MKKAELEAAAKLYVKNWETGERDEMEARLGNGFTYTSPRDDHLDSTAFLERCWPAAGKISLSLQQVAAIGRKDCVAIYEGKGVVTLDHLIELDQDTRSVVGDLIGDLQVSNHTHTDTWLRSTSVFLEEPGR